MPQPASRPLPSVSGWIEWQPQRPRPASPDKKSPSPPDPSDHRGAHRRIDSRFGLIHSYINGQTSDDYVEHYV